MKNSTLATTLAVALLLGSAHATADDPRGVWETIDDHTNAPKSHIRIYEENGALYGKVETLIAPPEPNPVCMKCSDERKDQPIRGMVIIKNMRRVGDSWEGGRILDPENGKEYRGKLTLTDGGKKLDVRGFVGISLLGRTQTWNRVQ